MANKEIVALTDFEHVLARPTMYIGSLAKSDEKVSLIKSGAIISEYKELSVGFYKMMIEILDNAFDEAKRQQGNTKYITISFNSKNNSVEVIDGGGGFLNSSTINEKTGVSNVESAMTMLRAGSNFHNDKTDEYLIGTNGVGASIVNMLSDSFEIETINDKEYYFQSWDKFQSNGPTIRKKKRGEKTGTRIKFTPRKDVFKGFYWDKEYIHATMVFKQFLKKNDPVISKLNFVVNFDGKPLDLEVKFIPEEHFKVQSKIGTIYVWESFPKSTSVSFVNGAMCGGIHQRIIGDWLCDQFGTPSAYRFYETFIVLNMVPKLVQFGDQNKTKFVTSRADIQPHLQRNFYSFIKRKLKHSPIFEKILKTIDEQEKASNLRKIRNEKRSRKNKISDKFFPPSSKTENLFIVEGGCVDEKEKIKVYRNFEHIEIPLSDIEIDDVVLTHNHRFKRVSNVQRKLKEVISIKTASGILKCSYKQPLYVYDLSSKIFRFVEAQFLDKDIHKLAKSQLSDFIGTFEVASTCEIKGKYPIQIKFENDYVLANSKTHKYCVFDNKKQEFYMKESQYVVDGDLIALFEKNILDVKCETDVRENINNIKKKLNADN
jgi:hypothetical protein